MSKLSTACRRFLYSISVKLKPVQPTTKEHEFFLTVTGQAPDTFDAIIMGAEAIEECDGDFTSHHRYEEQGGLTLALFLVKTETGEAIQAFYNKGGRFTDQCDAEGRNAEMILQERLKEASPADAPYLREALETYHHLVEQQGGLIHIKGNKEAPRRYAIWDYIKSFYHHKL